MIARVDKQVILTPTEVKTISKIRDMLNSPIPARGDGDLLVCECVSCGVEQNLARSSCDQCGSQRKPTQLCTPCAQTVIENDLSVLLTIIDRFIKDQV